MKLFLIITIYFTVLGMHAQDPVAVESIEEALIEAEKGNKVSLALLDDQSDIFPKTFFKIPPKNLVGLIIDGCRYNNIPKKLSKYIALVYFRYSWYGFDEPQIKSFPEVVTNLKNLQTLIIESTIDFVPESISNLKNLKQLDLYRTHLKDFPEAIFNVESIEILNLACNDFTILPKEINKLKKLKVLKFDGGGCGSTPINSIPESIGELQELKSISFGYSKQAIKLPDSFYNLTDLESFSCNGCGLSGFSENLGKMKNLKMIRLFNLSTFQSFPEAFFKLESLRIFQLYVSGTQVSKALAKQKKRLEVYGEKLEKASIEINTFSDPN